MNKKVTVLVVVGILILLTLFLIDLIIQANSSWQYTTPYPINVFGQGCSIYNSYIYCSGGARSNSSTSGTTLSYYAPIVSNGIGSWMSTAAYPVNASQLTCVTSEGEIYCLGSYGYLNSSIGLNNSFAYYAPLSSAGIGDWSATLPYPPFGSMGGCYSHDSTIYCVGGHNASSNNLDYYAPLSVNGIGGWINTTAYPLGISSSFGCAVLNSSLYCIGGSEDNKPLNSTYYAALSINGIGGWTATSTYPIQISKEVCTSANSKVYCIGGETENTLVNYVYYSQVNGSTPGNWIQAASYPIYPIQLNSCPAAGNYIYCIGGSSNGMITNESYYLNVS